MNITYCFWNNFIFENLIVSFLSYSIIEFNKLFAYNIIPHLSKTSLIINTEESEFSSNFFILFLLNFSSFFDLSA